MQVVLSKAKPEDRSVGYQEPVEKENVEWPPRGKRGGFRGRGGRRGGRGVRGRGGLRG